MKKLFLATLFFLATSQVEAATWWLRPSGGTTGTCAQARGAGDPGFYLRSFAALNACSGPAFVGGDTVKLKGGTYTEFSGPTAGFTIPSGTIGAPTILEAAGVEAVTFNTTGGFSTTFDINNQSYITLQGDINAKNFKIDLSGMAACDQGVLIRGTSHHITLRGMDIANCLTGNGVSLFGASNNTVLQYSRLHGHGGVQAGTEQSHAIYISTSNNTVEFTEIDNNTGYGLHNYDSTGKSTGNVFRNLNIHHNATTVAAGAILSGGSKLYNSEISNNTGARGIQVWGASAGVTISNVTLRNNAGTEIQIQGGATGTTIEDTVIANTIGSAIITDAGTGSTSSRVLCPRAGTLCTQTGTPLFEPIAIAVPTVSVTPASIDVGGTTTMTWTGISTATPTDWIGLYIPGMIDTNYVDWIYISCSKNSAAAQSSGSCAYTVSGTIAAGDYEVRLFTNDGFSRLATGNLLKVNGAILAPPSNVSVKITM